MIITKLVISLVLITFWGISPRNSTSFTRPFLTWRHAWAGHEIIPTSSWLGEFSNFFVTLLSLQHPSFPLPVMPYLNTQLFKVLFVRTGLSNSLHSMSKGRCLGTKQLQIQNHLSLITCKFELILIIFPPFTLTQVQNPQQCQAHTATGQAHDVDD